METKIRHLHVCVWTVELVPLFMEHIYVFFLEIDQLISKLVYIGYIGKSVRLILSHHCSVQGQSNCQLKVK
jgi:hypothetical protein